MKDTSKVVKLEGLAQTLPGTLGGTSTATEYFSILSLQSIITCHEKTSIKTFLGLVKVHFNFDQIKGNAKNV